MCKQQQLYSWKKIFTLVLAVALWSVLLILSLSKCLSLGSLLCQHDKMCSFQIFCYKLNFVKIKEMRRSRTPAPDLSHSAVGVSATHAKFHQKCYILSQTCHQKFAGSLTSLLTTCQGERRLLIKKSCSVFSYWTQLLQVKLMYSWRKRRSNVNRRQQYCRSYVLWIAFPTKCWQKMAPQL